MSEAYHNEALRKARVIEKQHLAMERMGVKHTEDCYNYRPVGSGTPYKAPGNYRDAQRSLEKFRVDEAGFQNRYRGRSAHFPHPDLAYSVIYPVEDNSDYTQDTNRNNRRQNVQQDRYDIRKKVNGKFDLKVYMDTVLPAAVK